MAKEWMSNGAKKKRERVNKMDCIWKRHESSNTELDILFERERVSETKKTNVKEPAFAYEKWAWTKHTNDCIQNHSQRERRETHWTELNCCMCQINATIENYNRLQWIYQRHLLYAVKGREREKRAHERVDQRERVYSFIYSHFGS